MCMLDEIRAKRDEIYAIARRHKAEKLWVFGSCARREERPDSDVDLLVKFLPAVSFRDYDSMEEYFSKLLGRNVDIVSSSVLPIAKHAAVREQGVQGGCCDMRSGGADYRDGPGWSI